MYGITATTVFGLAVIWSVVLMDTFITLASKRFQKPTSHVTTPRPHLRAPNASNDTEYLCSSTGQLTQATEKLV